MDTKARLEGIAHGYQDAVIFLTALHAGVFTALGERLRSAREVAQELKLDERATEMVLLALAGIEIVVREGDGRFRLAPEYASYLLPDGENTLVNILGHHYNLMRRWVRLDEVLRTGRPVPREQQGRTQRELRDFICGMADISRISSREVAERVDLSRHRRLLDVGGGPGMSSLTFAEKWPDLECVVFDLPEVVEIAREVIEGSGLGERVTVQAGDYHEEELGSDFDVVYVSNIIHSLGAPDVEKIYAKCFRALDPGGLIVIKDFFLDDTRTRPAFAARFTINMLQGTEAGRSYALGETRVMLARVGFAEAEAIPVAVNSMLVLAHKPQGGAS